jgi:hypothetical protein
VNARRLVEPVVQGPGRHAGQRHLMSLPQQGEAKQLPGRAPDRRAPVAEQQVKVTGRAATSGPRRRPSPPCTA